MTNIVRLSRGKPTIRSIPALAGDSDHVILSYPDGEPLLITGAETIQIVSANQPCGKLFGYEQQRRELAGTYAGKNRDELERLLEKPESLLPGAEELVRNELVGRKE